MRNILIIAITISTCFCTGFPNISYANMGDLFKFGSMSPSFDTSFPARSFGIPDPYNPLSTFKPTSDVLTTLAGIRVMEELIGTKFERDPKKLPKQGKPTEIPWPSDFFATFHDGINAITPGSVESATSKFAKAFGLDPVQLENTVSGYNGVDRQIPINHACKTNDECKQYNDGSACSFRKDNNVTGIGYCIPTWFGLCHAWGPASILESEPACAINFNGVKFGVMDIKALLIQSYDGSNYSTIFTGRRCGQSKAVLDEYGRYKDLDCRDVSPDFLHLAVTNLMGLNNKSFVVDVTADIQVWNQPVAKYNIELYREFPLIEEALYLVSPNIKQNDTRFPINSHSFAEVKMNVYYITEATSERALVKSGAVEKFIVQFPHTYILALDKDGLIIGGEYIENSKYQHIDFLWMPTSTPQATSIVSGIEFGKVLQLLELTKNPANCVV